MSCLMVMAGGTGGHVIPALSVAGFLRDRGIDVVWMGTRDGIEARMVPEAGFDIEWVDIRGLRGTGLRRKLSMPFLLIRALTQCLRILRRRRPDALLGMGGFAAGPGGLAGWLLRKPLLLHEANAVAGLTNRLLSPFARKVMTGFPETQGFGASIHTGNPVAPGFARISEPEQRLRRPADTLRLLVVGGSQGAASLNRVMPAVAREMPSGIELEILHQCGRGKRDRTVEDYQGVNAQVQVEVFIDDMPSAYQWADVVMCRAGAMTVAEICASGSAALLVPFPYAVGDHQGVNARYLSDRGAALLCTEDRLDAKVLANELAELATNRERLVQLARKARSLSRPQATQEVGRFCMEAMNA